MSFQGTKIESYRYDAFGRPTLASHVGSLYNNRFKFTGREWVRAPDDSFEFGFYDYRNRAYNPNLGRFMSEDSKGFDAGDYNLFRYCGNDPVDRVDPMGLEDTPQPTTHPAAGAGTTSSSDPRSEVEKYFDKTAKDFDAHAVEAASKLDSRLRDARIPETLSRMIDTVKQKPGQFHDLNFIRAAVADTVRAFLDGRIKVGTPQLFASYPKRRRT